MHVGYINSMYDLCSQNLSQNKIMGGGGTSIELMQRFKYVCAGKRFKLGGVAGLQSLFNYAKTFLATYLIFVW